MAGAQVDGTVLSGGTVPVGGGPEVRGGKAKKLKISWDGSDDFVMAFKISKVRVSKIGNVKDEKEYLKGAFLEHSTGPEEPPKLSFKVVEETGVDEGFCAETVREGDDPIAFGVPDIDEDDDID